VRGFGTEPMAERARASAHALGFANVEVRAGDALDVPVDSESVDFVISNGVLSLATDKRPAFGEVFRILKPGGQFLYADIIVGPANSPSQSSATSICLLWVGLCVLFVAVTFGIGILIAWLPLAIVGIWFVYRIVRGWLALREGRTMYGDLERAGLPGRSAWVPVLVPCAHAPPTANARPATK
jgi:SAM-dependent methyltransferase